MQMIDPLSWVMSGLCDSSPLTNYDASCSQSPRFTPHHHWDENVTCRSMTFYPIVSGQDRAVGTWAIRDVAG
jgi:hypothetical protein